MDENKLTLLKQIQYHIRKCCGNCRYSILKSHVDWGVCTAHRYRHLKHTDSIRQLSINRYGCCSVHDYEQEFVAGLDKFREFLR